MCCDTQTRMTLFREAPPKVSRRSQDLRFNTRTQNEKKFRHYVGGVEKRESERRTGQVVFELSYFYAALCSWGYTQNSVSKIVRDISERDFQRGFFHARFIEANTT